MQLRRRVANLELWVEQHQVCVLVKNDGELAREEQQRRDEDDRRLRAVARWLKVFCVALGGIGTSATASLYAEEPIVTLIGITVVVAVSMVAAMDQLYTRLLGWFRCRQGRD